MNFKEAINSVGDRIPEWTNYAITKIEENGFVAGDLASRIISILIILGLAWAIITFAKGLKPIILWLIKIAVVVLIISIVISTFIL